MNGSMGPFVAALSTERIDTLAESREHLAMHAALRARQRYLHPDRVHRWLEVSRTHERMSQEYRDLANQRRRHTSS